MGLEKILNPYIIDNVAAFGIGFTSGLRHSKYSTYSDKYTKKGAKYLNNIKAFTSVVYGVIPSVLDFMIRGIPPQEAQMLFATGMASSLFGFEGGKLAGYFINKKNGRLNAEEEQILNKNLDGLKKSVHSDNFKDFHSSLMQCISYMESLNKKKHGNWQVRELMEKRLDDTIGYCRLYKEIEHNNNISEPRNIIIETKYPRAHALILGKESIIDLSIHFDHYKLTEIDNFPMGIGMVEAKPNLSRQEIKWNGDIDKIINMVNSYKKENTIMLITGGHDECPVKKELDASKEFTMLYTRYLGIKQFLESHMDFSKP